MSVNFDCKYYQRQELENEEIQGSFDESESIVGDLCNHPENNPESVISKTCNINNEYCPYK